MDLAPLERQRLYRQVAEEIKRYILDQGFKKGDPLPTEAVFAQQLGVSRPTVREALKGLQMIGVLTSRKGSGHAVGAVDMIELARQFSFHIRAEGADFRELAETRLFLEVNILPVVAERATEEDFQRLQAAIQGLQDGLDQRDQVACVSADVAFHGALYEASKNHVLTNFAGIMKEFFADVRRGMFALDLDNPEGKQRVIREHQAICDALRKKDVRRAQELMYSHLSYFDPELADQRQTFLGGAHDEPRPKKPASRPPKKG